MDRSHPEKPFNSSTGGLLANEPVLFFSRDNGRTWTDPLPVGLPPGLVATPANPIIELEDGRWMAAYDRWHRYDEPAPKGPYKDRMTAFFSMDRGRTWGDREVMADGWPEGRDYWHGKTIRLSDGRLFTVYQSADMNNERRERVWLPLHYAFADKAGRNWSKPIPTPVPGQTNCPVQLPGGPICVVYTRREEKQPGFLAVISEDLGETWDVDKAVRLWDSTGWTRLGISRDNVFPRSRETMAFGAPSLIILADGDLYASWWCTYASITHTRWARLRVVD